MTTATKDKKTEVTEETIQSIVFAFSPSQFSAIQGLTLLCSAPKEMRPILQGVHFNRHNGALRLEATDSYAMGVMEFPGLTNEFTPFVVPATLLNKVKLTARQKMHGFNNPAVLVTFDGGTKTVTVSYDGATFSESATDVSYPNIQSIIAGLPKSPVPMGHVGLNPGYVTKIGKWFEGNTLVFDFSGENKAVTITATAAFRDAHLNATAYLMQVRIS